MSIVRRIITSIALTIIVFTGMDNAFGDTGFHFSKYNERVIVADTVLVDTICHGEDYVKNGFVFINPDAGNHVDSLKLIGHDGKDSTVYLDLFVGEKYYLEYYENICQGEEYHGHGFDITNPIIGMNVRQHTEVSMYGCDSIVVLKLMAGEVFHTDIEKTICYGENYYENGFTYHKPAVGDYEDSLVLSTVMGCDSIVRLSLHVKPVYRFNYTDTICFGDNYTLHGFRIIEPAAGIVRDSLMLTTKAGCDSTLKLNLYVAPVFDTLFKESICFGETYNRHGFHHENLHVGTLFDTLFLETVNGCDSIVRLELYVAPLFRKSFTDTICFGEDYHEHGFNYDHPDVGWITDSLMLESVYGCDSVVGLQLYVAPLYNINLTDTICSGESYTEYGFNIQNPGMGLTQDSLLLASNVGCDSTVRLQLYVAPVYDTTFADSICYGENYNKHGFNIENPEVGMIYDTLFLESVLGCDSIVRLELYVASTFETAFTDTICHGESYDGHGFVYENPEVGTIFDTLFLTTTAGCDSIISLELFVAPTFDTLFTDTICFGESYSEHGFNILNPEVGVTVDTLFFTTVTGCDSIAVLNLLVGAVYDSLISDVICYGEEYHKYGFDLDSLEVGTTYDTLFLTSIVDCDSTVRLELYVAPTFETLFTDTICFGESYFEHGFVIYDPQVGLDTFQQHLTTIHGCDSIVELYLYVGSLFNINLHDTICFGESYHKYNFDIIKPEAGLHTMSQELLSGAGCDSIVTLNLIVGSLYDTLVTDTICYGESYNENNFHYDNPEPGRYLDTLFIQTTHRCDSVIRLNLYVAPTYSYDVFDSICEGEDYDKYGLEIKNPGPGTHNYISVLDTYLGCDSVYNVTLKVTHTFATPEEIKGESTVVISNNLWTGKYEYTIERIPGCSDYVWSLWTEGDEGLEENTDWFLTYNNNYCEIIVTTPVESILKVWAGNRCGDVEQTKVLKGSYFDIDEHKYVEAAVFPNPFKDFVNVECKNIEVINLYNASGQKVKSLTFSREDKVVMDLGDLGGSLYLLEVITSEGRCVKQVSKSDFR